MGPPALQTRFPPCCKTLYCRRSYPVEVLEVELFEDGVSAVHLVPAHGSQVGQQLLPLLRAQPVGFPCLVPQGRETRRAGQCGRGGTKRMFQAARRPVGGGVVGPRRQLQTGCWGQSGVTPEREGAETGDVDAVLSPALGASCVYIGQVTPGLSLVSSDLRHLPLYQCVYIYIHYSPRY